MILRQLPTLFLFAIAGVALVADAAQDDDARKARRLGNRTIQSFNYEGVQLLPSRQLDQLQQLRDFYMSLHPNDILRGFRLKTKEFAPGKDLGGAYSERPLSFGQWLSGFARVYRATGDNAARARAIYLMNEWGATISDGGSYGYRDGQGNHYDYDKFVGGLVDMYEYADSQQALVYLDRITAWAEKSLPRSNEFALPSEWYTLSENLYRAYELTGEQRYRDFAKVWEYNDFWNTLARGDNIFQVLEHAQKHPSYHAYSHVNSLSSAAMAYSVTGEPKYLATAKNGYEFLRSTQLFATGGYGPEECFIVPNGLPETLVGIRRGEANVDVRFHFETSCGSWAGFKLARYLMEFTGEARYGDWIERLVYNGVGAMLPMNDYGMIMYGSSYNTYGAQKSLSTVWFCCQGSLLQTVVDYHNLIYFYDDENLYVNLYVPSRVEWQRSDGTVRLDQQTKFPDHRDVQLRIKTEAPSVFGLKFRVPLWAPDGMQVAINGNHNAVKTVPGTWATIRRQWDSGDRVRLTFDLQPRAEPLPGYVSPVAVMCGPVVMVQATTRQKDVSPPPLGSLQFPADYLDVLGEVRINPAHNLHTNQELRPFYEMKAGEYYRMYFNREGKSKITSDDISFEGEWEPRGHARYSAEAGRSFSAEFTGTAVVWEGLRHDDAGMALVKIDGKEIEVVDQYAYQGVHVGRMDQREVPFRWSLADLPPGKHKLKVSVTRKKNPASSGTQINVTGLTAYQ